MEHGVGAFSQWNNDAKNFKRFVNITGFIEQQTNEILKELIRNNMIGGFLCIDNLWKQCWEKREHILNNISIDLNSFKNYLGLFPTSTVNIPIFNALRQAIIKDFAPVVTYSFEASQRYYPAFFSIKEIYDQSLLPDDNEKNWPLMTLPSNLLTRKCIKLLKNYDRQYPLDPYLVVDKDELNNLHLNEEQQERIIAALYRFYSYSFIHDKAIHITTDKKAFQDLVIHDFSQKFPKFNLQEHRTVVDNSKYSIDFLPLSPKWQRFRDTPDSKEKLCNMREEFKNNLIKLLGFSWVDSYYNNDGSLVVKI